VTRTFLLLHRDRTDSEPKLNTDTAATDVASRIVSKGEDPKPSSPFDSVLISLADSVLSGQCCVLPQTMMIPTHPNWTHRSLTNLIQFGQSFGRFGHVWTLMSKSKTHDSAGILNDLGDLGESLRGGTCERAPACACARARPRPHPAVPPSSKNRPNRPNRPKGRSRLLVSVWTADSKSVQTASKFGPNHPIAANGGRSQ
jgi:hypothetical protein